ncbi:MAG: phosphoethanolamine--lipid A transferase EptA [Bacteroidetes bacterium]|nr:phosphoethanolamine--lipid A transferase EptA [Bacteroidota bacterium]
MLSILKNKLNFSLTRFSVIISVLTFLLFHFPFYTFVFKNHEIHGFGDIAFITSLMIAMLVANFFTVYLIFYLSLYFGKALFAITFIISATSVYFINAYGIIIDESMVGNVLNTNYQESSSFISIKLLLFVLLMGVIPAIFIIKAKIQMPTFKRFLATISLTLLFLIVMIFVNSTNWLWIDRNSKTLGGLTMPWSYSVNLSLFYVHKSQKNKKEILLPDATITDTSKAVVVLVIGESSRMANYSLYGYDKNTNPLLSKTPNVHAFKATSCGTYTIAGVKCILEYKNTSKLYEILPNYLYRNGADVIWRTTNSGEPPLHIKKYETKQQLTDECKGENCQYDEVLLTNLKEDILNCKKNKVLVILHTSTSHGPLYSQRYPPRFATFLPVCNSVELADCSHQELLNAYDNTIVYTDYLLHQVIEDLQQLKGYKSSMIFVSDHGESLGEKNLYMHGLPLSMAPKEQYEIPFIVWDSDSSEHLKPSPDTVLTQHNVFHSVLHFLGFKSPIYDESMNIFK